MVEQSEEKQLKMQAQENKIAFFSKVAYTTLAFPSPAGVNRGSGPYE